jgi:peptidoglycan hydrolase-like protein with peptidoglycan-binding domain
MQKVLYKKGFLTKKQIDGWHGPKTKEAIKKFQKKYKKKYNLKVTGTVDKRTLVVLCEV